MRFKVQGSRLKVEGKEQNEVQDSGFPVQGGRQSLKFRGKGSGFKVQS
jgi:hypothetical protein